MRFLMLEDKKVSNIDSVRSHTAELIEQGLIAESPVLIEAPPISGKTTSSLRLAAQCEDPVTYLAGRIDLYEEAIDELNDLDESVVYHKIPSPHRHCPTFAGEFGESEAAAVRRLYSKGVSGYKIHYSESDGAYTPCMADDGCEYIDILQAIGDDVEEIDVLVGHHSHLNRQKYVEDRLVIIDEFNPDPFVKRFPSPEQPDVTDAPGLIITEFIDSLREFQQKNSPDVRFPVNKCRDVTDIIENRTNPEVRSQAFDWFREFGVGRDRAEDFEFMNVSSYRHNSAHMMAPLLTFSLFSMQKLSPGVEVAPSDNSQIKDAWQQTDIGNSGYRVFRNRNTGVMYALQPPKFLDTASQLIALDGTPTVELWNTVFAPVQDYSHRKVMSRDMFTTFLTEALSMSFIQTGNGMNHYAGGEVSDKDETRFHDIHTIENSKFPLISTKQALEVYRRQGLLDKHVKPAPDEQIDESEGIERKFAVRNHNKVLSSNIFEDESLGVVSGSPFPGDKVVRRWAAFCGEEIQISGEGETKTFGDFGDRIYEHFTHKQVVQAALRFGRDDEVWQNDGATIYINTLALPDWFEARELRSNEKESQIILALIHARDSNREPRQYRTIESLREDIADIGWKKYENSSISAEYIRNVLTSLVSEGLVEIQSDMGRGGSDIFRWKADDQIRELPNSKAVVLGDETIFLVRISEIFQPMIS